MEEKGACIAGSLRLLNRVVTNIYDDALRPIGMTICQMTMLTVIGKSGDVTSTDVCDDLQIEKSTLSRNLNRMRQQGWLESLVDERGTGRQLRLTEAGEAMLEKGKPYWMSAQKKAVSLLGEEGVKDLVRLAKCVCAEQEGRL